MTMADNTKAVPMVVSHVPGQVTEENYHTLLKQFDRTRERNKSLSHKLDRIKKRIRYLATEKTILLERLYGHASPDRMDDMDHHSYPAPIETSTPATHRLSSFHAPQSPIPHRPTLYSPPMTALPPSGTMQKPAPGPYDVRMTGLESNETVVPSSRPKRTRRPGPEPKVRRVQPLERDPASGEYRLPARVGILTVHALGRVIPLPTYHNDRYIWPVGFKASRTYLSMVDPLVNTVYTCSVEENGTQGPKFCVVADDCPDQPIIANSATGVWTAIVKRANEIRHREHSNSASGPDYYGFTHATIAKMIQDLPGADQCLNYVWQRFDTMHQRTAAGVAAAAEKKLNNLEIMGSANKKPPIAHADERRYSGDASTHPHEVFPLMPTRPPVNDIARPWSIPPLVSHGIVSAVIPDDQHES